MLGNGKVLWFSLLIALISCSKNSTGLELEISSSLDSSSAGIPLSSSSTTGSSSIDPSSSVESSSSSFVRVLDTGTFVDDRNGQTYKTTAIGTQIWMAENLNFETTSGSYCYDDLPANCDTYGRLYTWEAVLAGEGQSATNPSGVQGVCPEGWQAISPVLKATTVWEDTYKGTDDFGFSVLPSGNRSTVLGYSDGGYSGSWWTSTEYDSINADYAYTTAQSDGFFVHLNDKGVAYSVRCVQD